MYCVKCKRKTESIDIIKVLPKNNRWMLKSTCLVCGSKKSSFIPSEKSGEGFSLNNLVNKLPIELHLVAYKGKYVPGGSFNNRTVGLEQRRIESNGRI